MAAANLLFKVVAPGTPFTIPSGFIAASMYPATGATYTITNSSAGSVPDVSDKISASIGVAYSFPDPPSLEGYAAHIITATGGNITVTYTNGK